MPFDPTLPANNSEVSSAELRDQFTSLKALIDDQAGLITGQATLITGLQTQNTAQAAINADLTARIVALENPAPTSHVATGFGASPYNGTLVPTGATWYGQPVYQILGGDFFGFDGMSWGAYSTDPSVSGVPVQYTGPGSSLAGAWSVQNGMWPAGTVS